MAGLNSDAIDEGRLDLVPMIDCIMLLLLFFMMTTKFSSEEKAIASLLPTDKGGGQSAANKLQVDLNQSVNISIYPANLDQGGDGPTYQAIIRARQRQEPILKKAWLRIGGRPPLEIDGEILTGKKKELAEAELGKIHAYLKDELKVFEMKDVGRDKQPDVVIHCYSGLSWKFALSAYDAVRAYEAPYLSALKITGENPADLQFTRAVYFAPPRVRNYSANELGEELQEIINPK